MQDKTELDALSPICRGWASTALPRDGGGDAMSAVWGHVVGVLIVVIMLSFIGIWIWAWLPHHKRQFDALARLPLDDDATPRADEDVT